MKFVSLCHGHETRLQGKRGDIDPELPRSVRAMFDYVVDKRGPGKVLMAGIALVTGGLSVIAHGVCKHADYLPILLLGLVIMGMGTGCIMTPISGSAVQTLAPHQVARGSTLITVNRYVPFRGYRRCR
jgi:MFS family permease